MRNLSTAFTRFVMLGHLKRVSTSLSVNVFKQLQLHYVFPSDLLFVTVRISYTTLCLCCKVLIYARNKRQKLYTSTMTLSDVTHLLIYLHYPLLRLTKFFGSNFYYCGMGVPRESRIMHLRFPNWLRFK